MLINVRIPRRKKKSHRMAEDGPLTENDLTKLIEEKLVPVLRVTPTSLAAKEDGFSKLMAKVHPVLRLSCNGIIIEVNDKVLALLDYRAAQQLVGMSIEILLVDTSAEDAMELFQKAMPCQIIAQRRDGAKIPVELSWHQNDEEDYLVLVRDLSASEEQRTEAKIQAGLLTGIFESAVDALIIIDTAGIIQRVNGAVVEMFGHSKEDLLGSNVSILVPEPYRSQHDQYLRNFLSSGVRKVIGPGRELDAIRQNGQLFPMELTLSEVEVEGAHVFCGFVRDMTFRAKLRSEERKRHLSGELIDSIFEAAVDGLVIIDERGIVKRANAAVTDLFGYTCKELVGENVSILMPEPNRSRHDGYIRAFVESERGKVGTPGRELEGLRKNGELISVELSLSVVESNGARLFCAFVRDLALKKQQAISQELILNMLPKSIAEQLETRINTDGNAHIAHSIESATVFFGDVVGFTAMSEKLPALTVVKFLNDIFTRFDVLAAKYGLEKIKTIGDCYLCVAGIPEPFEDHAERMVCFSLDVMDALADFNANQGPLDPKFGLRCGINSGSMVAGVVGTSKFLYDIWGPTINLSARLESTAPTNSVQISKHTFQKVSHMSEFRFISRGQVFCKGIGLQDTWLVERSSEPQLHFPQTWAEKNRSLIVSLGMASLGVAAGALYWLHRKRK